MTPDEALASHRAMIREIGEDILIRRPGEADVTVRARVIGYQPKELIGPIVQGDVKIIVLVDTLGALLPLTTNESAVVRGRVLAIKGVDDNTRRIGGTLIALELQAGN